MPRNWTTVGLEEVEEDQRERVGAIFDRLEWLTPPVDLPACPGLNIEACIRELRIPKVSRVSYGHELAPYGLLGIEGNYKNGRALVYILDRGHDCLVLCSDFFPREAEL